MWIKYNGKRINLSNKDIQLEHTTFTLLDLDKWCD